MPRLRALYEMRVRFQRIFDTAADRRKALRSLTELWLDILEDFPEMEPFICTFEAWQEEILNYFDARKTSGPVEGINNKARVITKRAYGLKSAQSLWDRLILDLNRASQAIGYSIEHIRQIARGLKALFDWSCT